jgi:23S rRNA (uracil1939-C5)-methyltransferase
MPGCTAASLKIRGIRMQKNDCTELIITGTAVDGSGVGRADGLAVFVPGAAEGDRVRVRIVKLLKNRAFGRVEAVLTPSPLRQTPDCPVFSRCGGCAFRHVTYAAEKEIKVRRVQDAIRRIGGTDLAPRPILAADERTPYRNKAQYPFAKEGDRVVAGFYAPHSHRVIPCEDCLLQPAEFSAALQAVCRFAERHSLSVYSEESGRGLLRHLYLRKGFATGQVMAVLVVNGRALPAADELVEVLRAAVGEGLCSVQLNHNQKPTNVVLGEECTLLWGKPYIEDILCGVRVRLSPLSFYQVNREMAERLYRKAAEYAAPAGKTVLDLYCGTGTIGLSMAGEADQVIGIEVVPQAVGDARRNAEQNGIENAEFLCADAAEGAAVLRRRGVRPDVVLLDPPRKGCAPDLLRTVAADFAPGRIVYVSCDPATLARDLRLLGEMGYCLIEYTPADLFPGTAHVETVAYMTKSLIAKSETETLL